jgi:hypothetical protein
LPIRVLSAHQPLVRRFLLPLPILCIVSAFLGTYRDILAPGYVMAMSTQQCVVFDGLHSCHAPYVQQSSCPAPCSRCTDACCGCLLLAQGLKGAIRALLGCAGRWMGMHVKSSLGLSLVLSVMLMSAMNLGSGCIWNHTHMPGLVVATTL